ncbi:MAG: hypothetical protein ACXW27_00970 [Allosphingosinicella sp.]
MSIFSPASQTQDRQEPWRKQLEAIESSDRHLLLTSIATSTLLILAVFLEAVSMLATLKLLPLASDAGASLGPHIGGAVALICACYIGFSLYRRRRDVVQNDIRDLRLQISHLTAREDARASDAAGSGASR